MKTRLLIGLLCLTGITFAQPSAMFTYNVSLNSTDSIDTQKWLKENPLINKENEIADKYCKQLNSSLRSDVSTTELTEQNILEVLQCNIRNSYKDTYSYVWWMRLESNKYALFHSNIGKKTFRDILFNTACNILCELVAYLPKDYKKHLLSAFNDALKMLNDIPNHKYEIKEDLAYNYKPLVIFKDGKADHELGYGINGFLLRRIYMDNIPYSEIKEKTITLINKLKAVDNSRNADVLCRYTINDEMMYCIAAESNYFVSVATGKKYVPYTNEYEKIYYSNIIKYRYNAGIGFYNIYNNRWSGSDNKVVVIDKNANVVYKE